MSLCRDLGDTSLPGTHLGKYHLLFLTHESLRLSHRCLYMSSWYLDTYHTALRVDCQGLGGYLRCH